MTTAELKIEVADIEVYRSLFLFCGWDPNKNIRYQYEISWRKNEIDGLVKHLVEEIDYMVSYNGCKYDNQVLQYILDDHEKWFDKSSEEIIELIYQFSQELISNQDYELQPPYKEAYMDIKQIDVFLIMHYDNKNRRTGLKWAGEFSLDGNIEELPIDYTKKDITEAEILQTIEYCWNDVYATHNVYKIVTGNTDHELYKEKDKIQLRLDLIAERGLPAVAINWNDGKIGDELNKKRYLELTGISQQKLWEKIKARKTRTSFTFEECYPSYWKFDTDEYQQFFKRVGKQKVNLNVKQEFPFKHYMFAKGGGHSTEGARIVKPTDKQILRDADIQSDYPWTIAKNMIYPAHLGPMWNTGYVENIPLRIDAKKKYKESKEKRYESFAESYKFVLNINFGKLLDRQNWQYDPFAGMRTTIGGQIDIFMLAEDIEQIPTAVVISMNTDGLVVLMDKEYEQQYKDVCEAWEKQVGNDKQGRLEYADYSILVQTSVNDYLAIKKDTAEVKKKGDWLTDYELHKNKSKKIIPLALEAFYVKGIPVEDTIRNHKNIFDYCCGKKSSRDYFYRSINKSTGEVKDLNKLIRYYISDPKSGLGNKIYKIKKENSDKTGPNISQCESDSATQVLFNKPFIEERIEDYHIDYTYYERACYKLIDKIDPEYARKRKIKDKHQLEMF